MSRTTWTSVLDLDLGCEVSGSVFPFLNRCRWMEESVRMLRRADGMQAASASDYHIPDVAGFQGKPPHPSPNRSGLETRGNGSAIVSSRPHKMDELAQDHKVCEVVEWGVMGRCSLK